MNEITARQNGLSYTGIYSRDKDEAKVRLGEIRKQGYKAQLVTVKDSPYSRSACIGQGYSVYVEARYFRDQQAVNYRRSLANFPTEVQRLQDELAAKIAELTKAATEKQTWLTGNGYSF